MSKMSVVLVLALAAACFIPEATAAHCSDRQLDTLETQIEICCRGLGTPMYGGYWQWSRAVTGYMREEKTCNLDKAPKYLESILLGSGYNSRDQINHTVTCVKNSIKYGICC